MTCCICERPDSICFVLVRFKCFRSQHVFYAELIIAIFVLFVSLLCDSNVMDAQHVCQFTFRCWNFTRHGRVVAWMDWWWFADSKVKIQDEGARTTKPRSRLWCGVTEACYCEKACVCACFVVTGIFYIHISEIGVLVEFEVKSEFERLRSLQGNATFSFYNNS